MVFYIKMISLTSQVFLDILQRKCDEICDNLEKLTTDVLRKIVQKSSMTLDARYKKLINNVNEELLRNIPIWNSRADIHKIRTGKSSIEDNDFHLFLNIHDHCLICIKFYTDGSFGVRKNDGSWIYEKHPTYDKNVIIGEYDTAWIHDFSNFLEEIYEVWN